MSLPDPALLPLLLVHLLTYGECNRLELGNPSREWLALLMEAGWVSTLAPGTYVVTPAFLALSSVNSETDRLRRVCFAVPRYRRYLIAIVAEGLLTAAQLSQFRDQVEKWVFQDVLYLAPEVNAILDEIEAGQGRLVERTHDSITSEFAIWHSRLESFATWDAALLGRTGTPDQLFTAVLNRADSFTGTRPTWPSDMKPLALLVDFDLSQGASGQLVLPPSAPWARARNAVHSSLPFYNYEGEACFDRTRPVLEVWQNVLTQQPYYRAMLRCAITAHFSSYVSSASEVILTAANTLEETQILGERHLGLALADLLPELVAAMGYWPGSKLSPEQVGRMLQHWMALNVIERRDGRLQLTPSYVQTLHEAERARMLLRGPARPERENFEQRLRECI